MDGLHEATVVYYYWGVFCYHLIVSTKFSYPYAVLSCPLIVYAVVV